MRRLIILDHTIPLKKQDLVKSHVPLQPSDALQVMNELALGVGIRSLKESARWPIAAIYALIWHPNIEREIELRREDAWKIARANPLDPCPLIQGLAMRDHHADIIRREQISAKHFKQFLDKPDTPQRVEALRSYLLKELWVDV